MITRFKPVRDFSEIRRNVNSIVFAHRMLTESDESISLFDLSTIVCPYYSNEVLEKILVSDIKNPNLPNLIHVFKANLAEVVEKLPNFYGNFIRSIIETNKIFYYETIRDGICRLCKIELVCSGKEAYCSQCFVVKKVEIIETVDEPEVNKPEKRNIQKHYSETIRKIYGHPPKDKVLPEGVINIFLKYLENKGVDIRDSLHYTHSLLDHMKDIGNIEYEGKSYKIKKYKNQANYILLKLYPDLEIPMLELKSIIMLKQSFMAISAAFQAIHPRKYGNNYMYTIFKILHLNMSNTESKQLLRFIFIQKPDSFLGKDQKLKLVNDQIQVFKEFRYTPDDIYGREDFYIS